MTALELADSLDKYYDLKKKFPQTIDDVVSMLRQQQDEIDSLKDKLMLAKQSLDIISEWTKK